MKQFFLGIGVMVLAIASQGCGSATGGLRIPGYEAAGVVAANAAMPYQILAAGQAVQPFYGAPYGYGNIPVCRAQDLAGVPPVSQPVIVRVEKSKRHQTKDVVGGAVVGAGLGGLSAGWEGAAYGTAAGAGGGLLVSNHEQELCLMLPPPKP